MSRQYTNEAEFKDGVDGGSTMLEKWKEAGGISVLIHPGGFWSRHAHNWWSVVDKDDGKSIRWRPFVCHEKDDDVRYKRRDAWWICPFELLLLWLDSQLADMGKDAAEEFMGRQVFLIDDGAGNSKAITVLDIVDPSDDKANYHVRIAARMQWVFAVLEYPEGAEAKVAIEAQTLGQRLWAEVKHVKEKKGDEVGNFFKTPMVFDWSYDKGALPQQQYDCRHDPDAEVDQRLMDLWRADAPDLERYCTPTDPSWLRRSWERCAVMELPFDDLFDKAVEHFDGEAEPERADTAATDDGWNDEAEPTAQPPAAKAAPAVRKPPSATRRPKRTATEAARAATNDGAEVAGAAAASEPAASKPAASKPAKRVRKARAARPVTPPPEPEPEDDFTTCGVCKFEKWPAADDSCPECGATAIGDDDEPPAAGPPDDAAGAPGNPGDDDLPF